MYFHKAVVILVLYLCGELCFYFGETKYLLYSHVIYRHGDRAPISLYPNDRNNASLWPRGLSQLTEIGMGQHFDLGNFIRNRYIDTGFLSLNYRHEEVFVIFF
jgi:hypothetical protein